MVHKEGKGGQKSPQWFVNGPLFWKVPYKTPIVFCVQSFRTVWNFEDKIAIAYYNQVGQFLHNDSSLYCVIPWQAG